MRLAGKVAVITGAGSGIGRAIALKFAEQGADVGIVYAFDEAEAQGSAELVQAAGRQALLLRADVRERDQVETAVKSTLEHFGRIDILVCSAGTYRAAPFLELSEQDWDAVIDTNLKGAFLCGQAAARAMVAAGTPGKILFIASTQAQRPIRRTAAYAASKSGISALARGMALELAGYRIGVAAICPGVVESAGNVALLHDPAVREQIEGQIPWGRVGQPQDVANLAAFLASDEAEYITGACLVIDGGLLVAGPQI